MNALGPRVAINLRCFRVRTVISRHSTIEIRGWLGTRQPVGARGDGEGAQRSSGSLPSNNAHGVCAERGSERRGNHILVSVCFRA